MLQVQQGHLPRECPNLLCEVCKAKGHVAWQCTTPSAKKLYFDELNAQVSKMPPLEYDLGGDGVEHGSTEDESPLMEKMYMVHEDDDISPCLLQDGHVDHMDPPTSTTPTSHESAFKGADVDKDQERRNPHGAWKKEEEGGRKKEGRGRRSGRRKTNGDPGPIGTPTASVPAGSDGLPTGPSVFPGTWTGAIRSNPGLRPRPVTSRMGSRMARSRPGPTGSDPDSSGFTHPLVPFDPCRLVCLYKTPASPIAG
ncbi:hypothetical protein QYE76_003434 [Lolium multiflorum]|uniref:Uncharacterized protein n=1 Tax=Lolium multiflorum TaxID=4521 RepID=A0AAD8W0G6_LOLMU|nr:hypothetical protein QYE76_003434 [Lolium multiflorum]